MRSKRIPAEEQYRLIIKCRQSGLTDHQWCVEHDIKPGIFYNWVKRLSQKSCANVPASTGCNYSVLTFDIFSFILRLQMTHCNICIIYIGF